MKPKSRGAGIMVSDFIDEHNGFLAFSDEEYERAKLTYQSTLGYFWSTVNHEKVMGKIYCTNEDGHQDS